MGYWKQKPCKTCCRSCSSNFDIGNINCGAKIDDAVMKWQAHNPCDASIQMKFFDKTHGGSGKSIRVRAGKTVTGTINCALGASLCFGASSSRGQQWGQGRSGKVSCDDCCNECKNNAIINVPAFDCSVPVSLQPKPQPTPTPEPAPQPNSRGISTGSGFAINHNGDLVTNAHVVRSCKQILAYRDEAGKPREASIKLVDTRNDLALLSSKWKGTSFARVSARRIKQGQAAFVYGYPLFGRFSSKPAISAGIVKAMVGIGDDTSQVHVGADMQRGNSGGPVIDSKGHIMGVAVSKMSQQWLQKNAGDVPQNINFAIKAATLRTFLDTSGAQYTAAKYGGELNAEAISAAAIRYTYLIACTL